MNMASKSFIEVFTGTKVEMFHPACDAVLLPPEYRYSWQLKAKAWHVSKDGTICVFRKLATAKLYIDWIKKTWTFGTVSQQAASAHTLLELSH